MSITNLKIENFKKFEILDINLKKPITLIYGENSSGKSSVLKALLGLVQTFSKNNKYETWNAQGELVDLGSYKDYIKDHNIKNKFSISIQSSDFSPYEFKYKKGSKRKHITEQKFTYEYDKLTSQARIYSFLETTFTEDMSPVSEIIDLGTKTPIGPYPEIFTSIKITKPKTRSHYNFTADPLSVKSLYGNPEHFSKSFQTAFDTTHTSTEVQYEQRLNISPVNEKRKIDETSFFKLRLYEKSINETESILSKIHYLGPIRMSPLRSYKLTSHTSIVGPGGEFTPLVLSYILKRSQQDRTKNKIYKQRYEKFKSWFQMIFPGYEVNVEPSEDVVRIKISYAGRTDSITDVGFGFSQILPILVQAAALEPGDTLVVEQPELHLHPKAQVAFAFFLTEASKSGVRFIIETHSEHILKGLQLNVSQYHLDNEQGFSPSHLKIYYFHKEGTTSEMTLNQWGEIDGGWPEGFFDENYKISSTIVKNKISSMNSNNKKENSSES
ncbi:DUF3696 domain-containing protein [Pseudomonas chlororaphis]|uniref:DUF3696 domain-containing protein n=1 Tax=Pseudomonas chlororaphis TaxID=587753 RepID=UPI0030D2E1ED